ncbi:hypothetical protein CAPTEDRAFT_203734 [Capitella teleta]|uniref:DUF7402 domain-containing protein n=1 Tax=Capitella teleta TaxID=283909 RepID=R7USA9_CAPTE|nr:hypothetical protein CAPTEDRAFT_203734 [Capitella teleta]|eukprot:ELU09055.1 hypothetical protein CAPTEDRAFT_203734 [Capitella teleta]
MVIMAITAAKKINIGAADTLRKVAIFFSAFIVPCPCGRVSHEPTNQWADKYFLSVNFPDCKTKENPHNNIALQSAGTTCATDKPGYKPNIGCYGAIDGSVVGSNSNDVWKFYAEAVGTWLRLTFDDFYVMKRISVMQPFWKDEKNIKKASLAFGGGSTHEVYLITLTNQEGYYWENFTLSPNEMSDTLLITITETFEPGRRTTGFVELQKDRQKDRHIGQLKARQRRQIFTHLHKFTSTHESAVACIQRMRASILSDD